MVSMAAFTLGEWGGLVVDYQEILFCVPFQDYFSSYETGQSVGGEKMGESPRETNRKQNFACLTCALCGA